MIHEEFDFQGGRVRKLFGVFQAALKIFTAVFVVRIQCNAERRCGKHASQRAIGSELLKVSDNKGAERRKPVRDEPLVRTRGLDRLLPNRTSHANRSRS